jgi:cyclopropane-fatty-acyl-phospholipid synthase
MSFYPGLGNAKYAIKGKIPIAAHLFLRLLSKLSTGHLQLTTPEHEQLLFGNAHQGPGASLSIRDWRACGRILRAGDIGFAESYQAGWIDTPDLTALLRLALRNEAALDRALFGGKIMTFWYKLKHWLRPNTRSGSRKNIHAHYDIGNPFYQLWLDPSWTYSSAIFAGNHKLPLHSAQAQKYQRIIDVLQLKAGQRVLEIGCGWGGFAEHAAKQGILVHGITISAAQLDIAQKRMVNAQLSERVKLELLDYRDLKQQYDAVVSIEMFEAVGEQFWPGYFATLANCLAPGGRAMVQSITIEEARFERYRRGTDFIQQYIFPGGMLPSPERFCQQAAKQGLRVADQYAFGRDYAETLRRWDQAFIKQREQITAQGFDDGFQRIWQMYFAYSEAGFDEGSIDVVQFLIEKV